jgi:hypothetical protein
MTVKIIVAVCFVDQLLHKLRSGWLKERRRVTCVWVMLLSTSSSSWETRLEAVQASTDSSLAETASAQLYNCPTLLDFTVGRIMNIPHVRYSWSIRLYNKIWKQPRQDRGWEVGCTRIDTNNEATASMWSVPSRRWHSKPNRSPFVPAEALPIFANQNLHVIQH